MLQLVPELPVCPELMIVNVWPDEVVVEKTATNNIKTDQRREEKCFCM